MTNPSVAAPEQRMVLIDDRGDQITLRQVDHHGSEHYIDVHKDLLPRLIQALKNLED